MSRPVRRGMRRAVRATLVLAAVLFAGAAGIFSASSLRTQARYRSLALQEERDERRNDDVEDFDWKALRTQNADLAGWLEVERTGIALPVVQDDGGHGGDWYLTHDFWGGRSHLGCPYVDSRCPPGGRHILVYGHTTDAPQAMFGPLSHAFEHDAFSALGRAHWFTPGEGDMAFWPLMALKADADYQAIQQFRFERDEDVRGFLRALLPDAAARRPDAERALSRADRVFTLVTCPSAWAGEGSRTIVVFTHAGSSGSTA